MVGRNPRAGGRARALTAVVLALFVVGIGAGTAGASADGTRVDKKKKVTKVTVVVSDTGEEAEMMEPHEDEEGTEEHDHATGHAVGSMSMEVTPDTVRAGKIKFKVTNEGTEEHELVVLDTSTAYDELPVSDMHEVNEATAVDEVEDIAPGETKKLKLKLKKGTYALVCNISGHYEAGMRNELTVT